VDSGSKAYLTFRVAHKNLAIEACHVRAVLPMEGLTLYPGIGPAVLGLASLSGQFFPVLDLRAKLDLLQGSGGRDPRIVVIVVRDHLAGFIADRVASVHTYHARHLRNGSLFGIGRPKRLLRMESIVNEQDLASFCLIR